MVRRLITAAIGLAVVAAYGPELSACGDKFLLFGRSVGYQDLLRASRPGAILIYSSSDSQQNPLQDSRFGALLDLAGHRYRTVKDQKALEQALAERRFDLVLADPVGIREVAGYIDASSSVVIVPVLAGASKADRESFERQYGSIVRLPAHARQVVDAIDKAMKLRQRRLTSKT